MNRLFSILLIFCLMLLHQECRVSNIDPEAVTTNTPDATVTVIGTPVMNDNVFVIDSSSVEVLSVTDKQIVLKGDLRFKNPKFKGGRLRANCQATSLTANMIVGISGLSGLPAVRLLRDASCTQDAGVGTVTTLYYSNDFPPLTGPTGIFKYLNLFVKHRYNVIEAPDEFEISKSSIKIIDSDGVKVSASQNAKVTITNKFTSEFTFHVDYGNQQNPDNPELQKLNYLGISFAVEEKFSATASIEGEITAALSKDLLGKEREIGEIKVPIGSTGLNVSIEGKLSVPATLSIEGKLKASGKLFDKTIKFTYGKEYSDGDKKLTDVVSKPAAQGESFTLETGSIDLEVKLCITPTINVYIGKGKWLGFELVKAPTKLALTVAFCYVTTYNCATTGNGIVMESHIEIVPKATFEITLLTTLQESIEDYIKENESTLTFETKALLRKVLAIPSEWSWPLADVTLWGLKEGKWTFPQVGPKTVFEGILCNGTQVSDSVVAPPPGPCIPQEIEKYLASPVPVGKQGLSGFAGLADGAGSTPPVFVAGSVFRVIPTLYSSTRRAEDAIYIDKEFGELRLRFTYPDGRLKVEVRQYDTSTNLLLNEQSTSTEVTGQGNVFRICATMVGATNGKTYSNQVVIMGRLNNTKRAISTFNYILLVNGAKTPNYLLNGGSIRVFRAERDATDFSRFRLATDNQPRSGSNLSLMTY